MSALSSASSSFTHTDSYPSDFSTDEETDFFGESEETLTTSSPSITSRYNSPFSYSSPSSSSPSSPAPQAFTSSSAILESAVIAYAQQINEIIKADPLCKEIIAELSTQAATLTEKGKTRACIGAIKKLNIGVMVTGTGELFILFNQKAPFGEGTYKRYHDAISTKTWTVVGLCSEQPDVKEPIWFRQDYKHVKHLTDRIIPKSYIHGENPCWLETKLHGDLADAIEADLINTQDESTRLNIAQQMAEELAVIHEKGKVHRDVKPTNYLFRIDEQGDIKVAMGDFGLAISIGDHTATDGGSIDFLPPQYFSRLNYDFATPIHDSWSLGISLLYLFEKDLDPTYLAQNPKLVEFLKRTHDPDHLTLWQNINWNLVPLTQKRWMKPPANKESLEFVIWKLLQVNPADRWTARQAADALRTLRLNQATTSE